MLIVDSKSIRNADTAKEKDYDAGKTSGIKLHIGVDAMGLPHAIYMTTANITDRSGAINMVEYCCDVKKIYPKSGKFRSTAAIPNKILRIQSGAF